MSMRAYKEHDDDDGHTIADMSDISHPPTFFPHRERSKKQETRDPVQGDSFLFEKKEEPFTREERRVYVLAALKASLLIAAAFIVGLGVAILVMVLVWG